MMTREALLWRLKYFIALVAIFMITSFAPPDCAADEADVAVREHASVAAP
jgi:hypothetical protein